MKRSLAMTVLALGLIAFGCDDEPSTSPDAWRPGWPVAGPADTGGYRRYRRNRRNRGSGGTGGTAGTGGTGGTRPADARRDVGADRAVDRGADRAADSGGADRARRPDGGHGWRLRRPLQQPQGWRAPGGISAGDFCSQFMNTCSFGTKNRYASMSDCVSKYGASARRAVALGILCDAKGGLGMQNCDLAAGFAPRLSNRPAHSDDDARHRPVAGVFFCAPGSV